MKKLFFVLALASMSLTSMAQDEPTKKYSVATNSFLKNLFFAPITRTQTNRKQTILSKTLQIGIPSNSNICCTPVSNQQEIHDARK